MCPNGGNGDGNNSHQSENVELQSDSGGDTNHVSIVEVISPTHEDDPFQTPLRVVEEASDGRFLIASSSALRENSTYQDAGSKNQDCNNCDTGHVSTSCICSPRTGYGIGTGSEYQASYWSGKTLIGDSNGQLLEKGERYLCGKCFPSTKDSGEPYCNDRRESHVDLDEKLDFLETLLEGKNVPLDTTVSMDSRPDWIDTGKMERGRKFALKYLLAVVYAEMVSLALLLTMRGSIQALVFTGKSNTPLTAFKRYISTVMRVVSWYQGDVLQEEGEARNNIKVVRNMHASVSRRMNSCDRAELASQMTLEGRGIGMLSSHGNPIQTDYENSVGGPTKGCPFAESASLSRGGSGTGTTVHLNQVEMSITQFGFMGLIVLYPEKFGVHGASEEDLEAFVHLWRVLGHYLGIKDRYNFCSGSLQETRQRCRLVLERWMKPIVSEATREWEHMYRCVVEGTSHYVVLNTYGGSLLYLSWLLGVNTPRLLAASSWFERILFRWQIITFCYLCKMYWVSAFINLLMRISLWRGKKMATVWYESLEKKAVRRYEKAEKGISTRL